MTGFQTSVPREMRTAAQIAADTPIAISVSLTPEVAYQLAQFAKRSTFATFYEFTEAHLPDEERKKLAYQMIAGIDAVAKGLADVGYAPR